jgi:ABC-type Fe3+-hydroxamate transport system substrate-binding protein
MKAIRLLTCLLMTSLLAACATQSAQTGKATRTLTDSYMQQTEHNAQSRAVTVYWVNPPKSEDLAKLKATDGS